MYISVDYSLFPYSIQIVSEVIYGKFAKFSELITFHNDPLRVSPNRRKLNISCGHLVRVDIFHFLPQTSWKSFCWISCSINKIKIFDVLPSLSPTFHGQSINCRHFDKQKTQFSYDFSYSTTINLIRWRYANIILPSYGI